VRFEVKVKGQPDVVKLERAYYSALGCNALSHRVTIRVRRKDEIVVYDLFASAIQNLTVSIARDSAGSAKGKSHSPLASPFFKRTKLDFQRLHHTGGCESLLLQAGFRLST
jgi:hypothetical protein